MSTRRAARARDTRAARETRGDESGTTTRAAARGARSGGRMTAGRMSAGRRPTTGRHAAPEERGGGAPAPEAVAAPVEDAPRVHRIAGALLQQRVGVLVVGCGGTGAAIAGGLPHLHLALLAAGHPAGLHVRLMDGDVVSETNCLRQPFSRSEVGLKKAVVLTTRINAWFDCGWEAVPEHLTNEHRLPHDTHVVISAVDTRAARKLLAARLAQSYVRYWLDTGNGAASGQYVLGEPRNWTNRESPERLRTAAELYPEMLDAEADARDTQPACSAVEALERQEPFVNQTIAAHTLALLARLFRHGAITHQGSVVNLATGGASRIPVGMRPPPTARQRRR